MQNWLAGFNVPSSFSTQLKAYSAPFFQGADETKVNDIAYGGKVILPSSALDQLIRLNIQYPMMFTMTNAETQRATNCGVLEFSAPEGTCYLPNWMMTQLLLAEGNFIRIDSASFPKATYAKLKPQSLDFLSISNPRAVLEVELRKFACLTKNDRIGVRYADQVLEFLVQDVKPANAVCIIECDLNLEFDAPEGYKEETYTPASSSVKPPAPQLTKGVAGAAAAAGANNGTAPATSGFSAFTGSGARLDGKTSKKPSSNSLSVDASAEATQDTLAPVVCVEDYEPGTLSFVRYDYRSRAVMEQEMRDKLLKDATKTASAFEGKSGTVRAGGNRR